MMPDYLTDYGSMPTVFGMVAGDFPWHYETWSNKGQGRSAENVYPTLTMPEIRKVDFTPLLDPAGSFSLQWVTGPGWPEQHDYFISIGLKYITIAFAWLKQTEVSREWFLGTGHYTRANVELCLLYGYGDYRRVPHHLAIPQVVVSPEVDNQISLWDALDAVGHEHLMPPIVSDIGPHSAKPVEFYRRAEMVHNHMNPHRLELFARHRQPGWWATGLDLDGLDIREALPMIQAGAYTPKYDRLAAPPVTHKRGADKDVSSDQLALF